MSFASLDAVLITGAGRGLGKACALKLAASGLPVFCISRSSRALATRDEIRAAGGRAEALEADLGDTATVQAAVSNWIQDQPHRRWGIVLSAGTLGVKGGLLDSDPASWDEAYRVNVLGNLAVVKALLPRMLEARFGRIIGLAGGGAAYAYPLFAGYALSKTAMVRAIENLHEELKGMGDFQVVCLAPGALDTDILTQIKAAGAEVRTTVPMREPVAFVEAFLRAEATAFSGRFLHVRDSWKERLGAGELPVRDLWLLRRVEK